VAGGASFAELLRLGECDADQPFFESAKGSSQAQRKVKLTNADGKAGSNPENCLPAFDRAAYTKIGACCTDVAEGVALLQDARHQA
jgi:hypothetical protein